MMRGTKIQVTFGLVTIPCKRGPSTRDARQKARRLCADHMTPIKLQAFCAEHEHACEETVSGYELEDGTFAVVDREVAEVAKDGQLTLTALVDDFDPAFYVKTELLIADKGGENAFAVLATALRDVGGSAVGSCVLNKARRMVALRWSEALGCVVMHHLAYDAEVRWDDAEDPGVADERQVALGVQILEALDTECDLGDESDEYDGRLREMVEARKPRARKVKKQEEPVDVMAALRESLEEVKQRETTTKNAKVRS